MPIMVFRYVIISSRLTYSPITYFLLPITFNFLHSQQRNNNRSEQGGEDTIEGESETGISAVQLTLIHRCGGA